jgi:SNF2 family DNA or RNA helicase
MLRKGVIIESDDWAEPLIVENVEDFGNWIEITGRTHNTDSSQRLIIEKSKLEKLKIREIKSEFSANPREVFLALETKRYRYISLYDPLLAVNTSKVEPLPHQIEAVYDKVLKLPRIRFLIADDPGAGKTIMAGLIIKELKIRGLVNRILIVTPGHLKDQWRRELKEKFSENFVIVDRGFMNSLYGENPWLKENQIITSIDFAKREEILSSLSAAHFDLIIVDEAHKLSAFKYGDKVKKSKRYRLGETLSQIAEHLLFLTATPHRGDAENFRLFLDLLEPGFFATKELLEESIKRGDNPLFIRRLKEDLKDFEGRPLFLPRHVKTLKYSIKKYSSKEVELYNALSRYVEEQYNKALSKDKNRRFITFALVILQRRFASSIYALYKSLMRRKKRLESLLEEVKQQRSRFISDFDFEELEELSEEERWAQEELLETLSLAENRRELEREIATLEELIQMAKEIIENEEELKIKELKSVLSRLNEEHPGEKLIIFTESKDTLEYLSKKIKSWGYSVTTIHGGMSLEDRIKAEKEFKHETQVLVATEAAGEGINLQFCHLMINYDIPWNPNRLEQRMGRIHRFGQNREVFIYNLVSEDTREGKVLNKLFEKLEEIRKALGSDKVFDVISEVFEGKDLAKLLVDAAVNARTADEILKEIDEKVDVSYLESLKEKLGESLATKFINYSGMRELRDKALEHKLIPEYTESFFEKAFTLAGGRLHRRRDGFISIESIPYEIKEIAREDEFRRKFGQIISGYRKVTFDKEQSLKNPDAEFLSFGHPLFEAVLEWVERKFSRELVKGATFYDPDGKLNGYILFYEGSIVDGKNEVAGKRIFSFYVDEESKEVREISPTIIWDLKEGTPVEGPTADVEELKKLAFNSVLSTLSLYKEELLKERTRQAEIKKRYGVQSLHYLIKRLNEDLFSLHERKERGEDVDLVIRNKEERRKKYQKALKELERNIRYETNLNITSPKFVGIIRVLPDTSQPEDLMVSDAEIEKIGMRVAMDYERSQGRIPEDVSAENLGFDIRSKVKIGENETVERYIEVKARAGEGSVALTQNEWFKAQRFRDKYYLYVVLNAATNPELYVIKNPAESLEPSQKVEVRYLVPVEQIKREGSHGRA